LRQLALSGDKDGYFDLRRFFFEKKGQSGGEIRRGSGGWHKSLQLAISDSLVQLCRFCRWLDAQLFNQEAATGLVLGQGSAPLATER
jgi:hypothetical protein